MKSRWLSLAVLAAGQMMIILDGTISNVALPAIQRDLGFTPGGLAWVVNAYLIAFGGLLLLFGRLGDLLGRKRMFVSGLVVFVAASVLAGLSGSQEMLVAARFLQGAGGAMTSAVVLGMIVTMFPEPGAQAKAIGVYSFVGAAGASVGVLGGGVLTELVSWHWIFFVNLPLGLGVLLAALRWVDGDTGAGLRAGADGLGALLVTGGMMLAVYAIVTGEVLMPGGAAAVLLTGFVVRQARTARPLLPLRVFRSREVTGANLVQVLVIGAMLAFQYLLGLYLQDVLGYGPLGTGLAFLPITVAIGAVALGMAARLIGRYGTRAVLVGGLVALVAGYGLLTRVPDEGSYVQDVLPALVLLGIGGGLTLPAMAGLAMSGVSAEDSGIASGLANTTQQIGGAIGVAVLATVAAGRTAELTDAGRVEALAEGYRLAFQVGAGVMALALVVALVVLRERRAPAPAVA
ncbi:MFS transporter [Longispora albida]|uniref:MFS transporter n=1 Tax=Longispora albida TaxID=203523 RepID=UPI00035FC9D5|nr:MFS transporter [Longispora albida]